MSVVCLHQVQGKTDWYNKTALYIYAAINHKLSELFEADFGSAEPQTPDISILSTEMSWVSALRK